MPANSSEIVTFRNDRGMEDLLHLLGDNPCRLAAKRILEDPKEVILCTGFPVNGHPETDGPPGTVALAKALKELGRKVTIMSWSEANDVMKAAEPKLKYKALPKPGAKSTFNADDHCIITVEICSRTEVGLYLNMHGSDITSAAPKFEGVIGSVADVSIGDGGNEFGMGSAPKEFFEVRTVVKPITTCHTLVPATVSNFGAYAIVAELEIAEDRDLLPAPGEQSELISAMIKAGAVDGFSGDAIEKVDGADLEETESILDQLRDYAATERSGK